MLWFGSAGRRRAALVAVMTLLAALLGGDVVTAEPTEIPAEIAAESGLEEEVDGEDGLFSRGTSLLRSPRPTVAHASRHARSLRLGHALGARGPPSHL